MIKTTNFGEYEGKQIYRTTLVSSSGVQVDIMNFGATICDWRVPVMDGNRSVVLGFDQFENYANHGQHFGAIIGRVASRIHGSKFSHQGKTHVLAANDKNNQLHGGIKGLSQQVWALEGDSFANQIKLTFTSKEGDMGFPGQIKFSVTYQLSGNRLRIELDGKPDCSTPISLTQHNYFNLSGERNVLNHQLWIDADHCSEVDEQLLTTGNILPVANTVYDFGQAAPIGWSANGAVDLDINLVLNKSGVDPVAIATSENGDLTLKMFTDRPGLQLYNGVNLPVLSGGTGGRSYGQYSGFCLEDQMLPGALAHKHLPAIICDPEHGYTHWCEIEIG